MGCHHIPRLHDAFLFVLFLGSIHIHASRRMNNFVDMSLLALLSVGETRRMISDGCGSFVRCGNCPVILVL